MKMNYKILFLIPLFFSSCSSSEKNNETKPVIHNNYLCSFDGNSVKEELIKLEGRKIDNQTIDNILKEIGLPSNFEVYEAKVPNACAFINLEDNSKKRYILYNQDYFNNLNKIEKSKWIERSILAHEIGHHLAGHTLGNNNANRKSLELEADYFAGFILGKMGANEAEACLAYDLINTDEKSSTHPASNQRIKKVKEGWNSANKNENNYNMELDSKFTTTEEVFVINIAAYKDSILARNEVIKLRQKGYRSNFLYIPDYKFLGKNKLYQVFIGPYYTSYECGLAVETYRSKNPSLIDEDLPYGIVINNQVKKIHRIDGINNETIILK